MSRSVHFFVFCLFFEELLRMSEENERGRIFTDSWSESDQGGKKRKKQREGGERGGKGAKADAFF